MRRPNAKPTVVGLGEILWDLFPNGKQLGGAPANFAYHAHALGAEGVVASCIGVDTLGEEAREQLAPRGLILEYLATDPAHPTGTVSVKLDAKGVPNYIIREEVAWDFVPCGPQLLDLASRTQAVCFGTLAQRSPVTRNAIRSFLNATPAECLRVFDINLRQRFFNVAIVQESLALSSVLKLNTQELSTVASLLDRNGNESDIVRSLFDDYPLQLVAITRGERGSVLYSRHETVENPGYPPPSVADTVGAGDAFAAMLTMGLLGRWRLPDINTMANRLASFVCSQEGAMPLLPETVRDSLQTASA